MIDKKHIGRELPAFLATAEAGQLRFFAKATGETNPIYFDEQAARDAGHPGLPLAPTFLFSLEFQIPSNAWREELGIVTARILHGEESFRYHRMAYAGDTLRFAVRIADIYDKKDGALEFVVRETRVTNQHGEHVADLRSVLVQRNS
ncbi:MULTISPECIES: MaoC family dehydratase N-terminal domain-containing protein [Pseudomonas]|uniref:MaoC family dehydratase N-terminal domain-containing protein n=1 Tax=Pseudomonas sp. Hg7Tf TaxID=3236988 RepID=A0AB39I8Z5_9PSED|nr:MULTISPECIES: MaoC family dehydratase N-terminal domain-containing protein [Pseudomonas]KJK06943.1 acyl dehydratase [Pseudomonas sp. 5]MDD1979046.1 MaoC family dehydratase N-terminal domain-containing protein [Pseudomonas putida]MDH2561898.1 MaoC family dehydratase N-terminal domain-containing protein [Pseudomonas sp. Hg5Tf]